MRPETTEAMKKELMVDAWLLGAQALEVGCNLGRGGEEKRGQVVS